MIVPGVRFQFRQSNKDNLIRCYLASDEQDPNRVEVSTLCLSLAQRIPSLYEKWQEAMQFAMNFIVSDITGVDVANISIVEEKLTDRN